MGRAKDGRSVGRCGSVARCHSGHDLGFFVVPRAVWLVTVTVDVEEWIKPADGPTVLVLKDIVDPGNFGGEPWKIGGRRLLYVPEPGDLRFTPAEVGQTGLGLDGGKSLDDSIQGTKTELAQGLRTTCPSK